MAATMAAFALAVKISGHISVGSMTAAISLPIAAVAFHSQTAYCIAAAVAGGLIIYKHIPNLQRLRQNKELGIHGPSA
jgi:glycerol-3-phosphate acyltransferase PlsY